MINMNKKALTKQFIGILLLLAVLVILIGAYTGIFGDAGAEFNDTLDLGREYANQAREYNSNSKTGYAFSKCTNDYCYDVQAGCAPRTQTSTSCSGTCVTCPDEHGDVSRLANRIYSDEWYCFNGKLSKCDGSIVNEGSAHCLDTAAIPNTICTYDGTDYSWKQNTQVVILYESKDYGGSSESYSVGEYTTVYPNDDASSIQIAVGYKAILYEDTNFEGNSQTIIFDKPDFEYVLYSKASSIHDNYIDDDISSMRVIKT
jgi:hypothetical protein